MIESFTIENYRSFEKFKLSQIGRVNLLVGENNSGKTSILEGISLYLSYPYLIEYLSLIFDARGDFFWKEIDNNVNNFKTSEKRYTTLNLFNNRIDKKYIDLIVQFNGKNSELNIDVIPAIMTQPEMIEIRQKEDKISKRQRIKHFYDYAVQFRDEEILFSWGFKKFSTQEYIDINFYIDENYSFSIMEEVEENTSNSNSQFYRELVNTKIFFINPFQQDINKLIKNFDAISLTPLEEIVIDALKIIDPRIKRIATSKFSQAEKSSFKLLLENEDKPISMSTMGDGIWQLLTIILAMVNCQDGVVLIDEIDTGLHFTTLVKMWELIIETSKKLNVQVFATTHNSDCWRALGKVIEEKNRQDSDYLTEKEVTLHRIEPDKEESILFDAEGIVIAKDNDIEVR